MIPDKTELFVKMAIDQWLMRSEMVEKILVETNEDQYKSKVVKDGNSAAWIICHLIHANENLLALLNVGDPMFPRINEFARTKSSPEKVFKKEELIQMWKIVNARLQTAFDNFSVNDWFGPHGNISNEDFKKEPYRNKLNVLMSRTNHMAHHTGQLQLLKYSK